MTSISLTVVPLLWQDTPLHMASREGHSAAVTLLLSMGAELKKNKEEMHFFDLAVKNEHKEACIAVVTHDRYVF